MLLRKHAKLDAEGRRRVRAALSYHAITELEPWLDLVGIARPAADAVDLDAWQAAEVTVASKYWIRVRLPDGEHMARWPIEVAIPTATSVRVTLRTDGTLAVVEHVDATGSIVQVRL